MRSSRPSASTPFRSGCVDGREHRVGSCRRARDPCPPEDADEDVLPVRARVLRRTEYAHVPVGFKPGGTPLVEIVTRPDLRPFVEARRLLRLRRQATVEIGISEAEMEKGARRVDANVSLRPVGADELRTRWKLKNMSSFT